jgi:hypothetical protein
MNSESDQHPSGLPASSVVLERVRSKLLTIVNLTREVFISPYDLYLVDRATGVLGGFCQGNDQQDPNLESESGRFADSEELLRDTFSEMKRPLPWIFTASGAHYFLPAITMDTGTLHGFTLLPYAEKVRVVARMKMCLADGERVPGFEHLDPEELGPETWGAMFDCDPAILGPESVDLKQVRIRGPVESGMWMDRYLDRIGAARPLRMFEKAPLEIGRTKREFWKSYRRARRVLPKKGSIHGPFPGRG